MTVLTIKQFAATHGAFTEGALRALVFWRRTNGFEPAFVKVGRRVLIDEGKFFECIQKQQGDR